MRILILAFIVMSLTSCMSWKTQLSTVSSDVVDEKLIFENEDVKLKYSFWDEGGKLGFTVENKTDGPIFIDWTHCNFIFNGYAYDFYSNEEKVDLRTIGVYNTTSVSSTYSYDLHVTKSKQWSKGTVTKDKESTQIPPNSQIQAKIIGLDFPWLKIENGEINFPKDNSPLTVRNYLSYSKNSDLTELNYVDNEFWVSSTIQAKGNLADLVINEDQFYNKSEYLDTKKTAIGVGGSAAVVVLFWLMVIATTR